MTRYTLAAIRDVILGDELLGDEWITATELLRELELGNGNDYYRVALVLERLVIEGLAEIRNPRSHGKRWFRRRRPEASS